MFRSERGANVYRFLSGDIVYPRTREMPNKPLLGIYGGRGARTGRPAGWGTERANKLTYRRPGTRMGRLARSQGGADGPAGALGDRAGKQTDRPMARNTNGSAGSGSGGR